jgi:hypothetical protein
VPKQVIHNHCAKYKRQGKPWHLMQRTIDTPYSIVAQYQTEYVGVVQYYRLAYNLHQLSQLKWVMETSLVRTLAKKLKISKTRIYRKYKTTYTNQDGTYKVLEVVVPRKDKSSLVARFGGVSLKWNRWAAISEAKTIPIWSKQSEVVERLLAQKCELCGCTEKIEAHHIRKLSDLDSKGQTRKPEWAKRMAARCRKSLIVCQSCHNAIHSGQYDGPALSK